MRSRCTVASYPLSSTRRRLGARGPVDHPRPPRDPPIELARDVRRVAADHLARGGAAGVPAQLAPCLLARVHEREIARSRTTPDRRGGARRSATAARSIPPEKAARHPGSRRPPSFASSAEGNGSSAERLNAPRAPDLSASRNASATSSSQTSGSGPVRGNSPGAAPPRAGAPSAVRLGWRAGTASPRGRGARVRARRDRPPRRTSRTRTRSPAAGFAASPRSPEPGAPAPRHTPRPTTNRGSAARRRRAQPGTRSRSRAR